jgi:hypothetical protein
MICLLFFAVIAFAQSGAHTQGIKLSQSNFCKTYGCKLVKKTAVGSNSIESYALTKMGKNYVAEFTWINEKSSFQFIQYKLGKPNSAFVKNAKVFLRSMLGAEAMSKFSTSRCKTFDEFLKIYFETGVSVPEQGFTVESDGFLVRVSCIVAPLTQKINASERYKFPNISVIISNL